MAKAVVHLQERHLLAHQLAELARRQLLDAAAVRSGILGAGIAHIRDRHAQEVRHRDAGNDRRVLEGQEQALARPLIRLPLEDVLALVADAASVTSYEG